MSRRAFIAGLGGAVAVSTAMAERSPAAAAAPVDVVSADPLLPEAYTKLIVDGLAPAELSLFEGLPLRMVASGGVAWTWNRPNTDLVLDVARLAIPPDAGATWQQILTEEQYDAVEASTSSVSYLARLARPSGLQPVAVLRGGTLTYVSVPAFAKWVA